MNDARLNDAKARHRMKRATNVAIFDILSSHGFRRGQSGGSYRNFTRRDLTEQVYVELSANGVDATWKDTIDYQPWLTVFHETVEGLVLASAGERPSWKSPGTVKCLLTQLVSHRWGEWSVLTDDDVLPVASDLATGVLGPGLEFARSVQTLDGLIRFLIVRPTWSTCQLPAALALARDTVQLDVEIARTALFSKNTVLSDYTNAIAGFAMGLYEELGRGLRNDAEYVRIYRDTVRTSAKARREEWQSRWPPPSSVDDLVQRVTDAALGPANQHGYVASKTDSREVYPYPHFRRELAKGVRIELVIVPERFSPDVPIRLLPLLGVTHLAVQARYTKARSVMPRLFYLIPFTQLVPLSVACPGVQPVWSARDEDELAAVVSSIFGALAERGSAWLRRTMDLDGMAETLLPLSTHPETSFTLAAIYGTLGRIAAMQDQLELTLEQIEHAGLTPMERSLLTDAQHYAGQLRVMFGQ